MPEGPEVTIITNGINKLLKNKTIINFEVTDKSRYHNKLPDGFIELLRKLKQGLKIKIIKNKGKFIYWIFNDDTIMFQTLGMSGGWYNNPVKHSIGLIITYLDKKKECKLYYNDQRRFGTIKIFNNNKVGKIELENKLKSIGPDLLNDNNFEFSDFIKIIRNPKLANKNITRVITNQKIISGIGNYLKAESLYMARINPHKEVKSITDNEFEQLFKAMKNKIKNSYKVGGASIRHYSDINNIKGKYEFVLEVYGKKKDKDNNLVIAEKIAGDTQNTYWCPNIQK
jgi:DNA-formamidopyrimidine glycosylase